PRVDGLEHEPHAIASADEIVNMQNIGVVELGEETGFTLQGRSERRRRENARAERLDEHRATQRLLDGMINIGDGPLVQSLDHLAAVEIRGRRHMRLEPITARPMGKPVLTGGQTRTGFDKLGPMTWPWRFFASFRGPHGHGRAAALGRGVAAYFTQFAPHFWVALAPALILAAVVYSRSPASNFIFDEQEALLANPYINGDSFGYLDAFRRDFWGLPPTRTIGSYRPLPNLIW